MRWPGWCYRAASEARDEMAGMVLLLRRTRPRLLGLFPFPSTSPPFSTPPPPRRSTLLFCNFSTESFTRKTLLLSPPPPSRREIFDGGGGGFSIELVDPDLWQVSSGLAHAWRAGIADETTPGKNTPNSSSSSSPFSFSSHETADDFDENFPPSEEYSVGSDESGSPDFDEIEDMRHRRNLFYKLDRGSREFEEYGLSLFRRQNKKNHKSDNSPPPPPPPEKRREKLSPPLPPSAAPEERKKEVRVPTFNQITEPYHLPFCLDIYVSKGSVRACVVHRATSRVVAVAHSISKDMKFDLASRRDAAACAAVGAAMAQRALADDIHNVVYTPRRGERVEGKIQVVLQAIIDSGIDVKVKIKQRNGKKNPSKR